MDFVERIKFFLESSHAIEVFSQGRELGHCDKNAKNKSTLNSTGTGLSTLVETRSVSGNLRVYFGIVFAFIGLGKAASPSALPRRVGRKLSILSRAFARVVFSFTRSPGALPRLSSFFHIRSVDHEMREKDTVLA